MCKLTPSECLARQQLHRHVIVSAQLTAAGEFEVVRRYPSNSVFCDRKPVPDYVIKEVYSVVDGKIALLYGIEGKHTPSYTVAEKIEFPE